VARIRQASNQITTKTIPISKWIKSTGMTLRSGRLVGKRWLAGQSAAAHRAAGTAACSRFFVPAMEAIKRG
jgi:hypothetical protein